MKPTKQTVVAEYVYPADEPPLRLAGMRVVINPDMPPGEIEICSPQGSVRVVNIGKDEG